MMKIKVNGKRYKVENVKYDPFNECYIYLTENEHIFNDNDDKVEVLQWR